MSIASFTHNEICLPHWLRDPPVVKQLDRVCPLIHSIHDFLDASQEIYCGSRSKNDLLAPFVERGLEPVRSGGRLAAITSRICFFLSSFQKWREDIVLGIARPEVMADFGCGVMDDAIVEAAAYVLEKQG
jgi:hypothetical protein